jgi:hypothetical protein
VFCGTWNVNGRLPVESLKGWLCQGKVAPDIYAIGCVIGCGPWLTRYGYFGCTLARALKSSFISLYLFRIRLLHCLNIGSNAIISYGYLAHLPAGCRK